MQCHVVMEQARKGKVPEPAGGWGLAAAAKEREGVEAAVRPKADDAGAAKVSGKDRGEANVMSKTANCLLRIRRRRVGPEGASANALTTSSTHLAPGNRPRSSTMPLTRAPMTLDNSSDWGSASRNVPSIPTVSSRGVLKNIAGELKVHAPFTIVGALTGVAIMVILSSAAVPRSFSTRLFWGLHPLHVLLSALVTAGMYRLHGTGKAWATILIGYLGSVGIATVSDCIIPYIGETMMGLPNKGTHVGFIEKWWLVNPIATIGIAVAYLWPETKLPHAGHVLLSTWASLFHMTMAAGGELSLPTMVGVFVFLFFAVWVPCCTSDIVFPLLFLRESNEYDGSI